MSDESGLGGFSLLELFKAEAETHCAALSEGLLALERSPGGGVSVEPLMRAAHSLKGAARIVGLDAIVPLAHAMEDCFESARGGALLSRTRIDLLLRCVDVLSELRAFDDTSLPAWTESHRPELQSLADSLRAPDRPTAEPAPESSAPSLAPTQAGPSTGPAAVTSVAKAVDKPAAADAARSSSAVRVAASTMNHLLALSAESAVEAGRAGRLREDLRRLKSGGRSLESAAAELYDVAARLSSSDDVSRRLSGASAALQAASREMQRAVADHDTRIEETLRRYEELTGGMHSEVMRSRMRPFSEAVTGFPRMVRDIAKELGKQVSLLVHGGEVQVDRDVLQKLDAPLTHLVRNASTTASRPRRNAPRRASPLKHNFTSAPDTRAACCSSKFATTARA